MGLTWKIAAALEIEKRAKKKIVDMAYKIEDLSKQRCPVDTGTLRNSCQVIVTDDTVTVSYGGAAASYAMRQHEDLSLSHPEGQAKFLETAFNEVIGSTAT